MQANALTWVSASLWPAYSVRETRLKRSQCRDQRNFGTQSHARQRDRDKIVVITLPAQAAHDLLYHNIIPSTQPGEDIEYKIINIKIRYKRKLYMKFIPLTSCMWSGMPSAITYYMKEPQVNTQDRVTANSESVFIISHASHVGHVSWRLCEGLISHFTNSYTHFMKFYSIHNRPVHILFFIAFTIKKNIEPDLHICFSHEITFA